MAGFDALNEFLKTRSALLPEKVVALLNRVGTPEGLKAYRERKYDEDNGPAIIGSTRRK